MVKLVLNALSVSVRSSTNNFWNQGNIHETSWGNSYLIFESIIKVRLVGELCCDVEKFSFVVEMKNGSIVSLRWRTVQSCLFRFNNAEEPVQSFGDGLDACGLSFSLDFSERSGEMAESGMGSFRGRACRKACQGRIDGHWSNFTA